MASRLVSAPRNAGTIATLGGSSRHNVVAMTVAEEQDWLRPSPGLWRMRRAELVTFTALGAAFFGLVFLAALGPLAGAISLGVVLALGGALAVFVRRRYKAWRYQERH
jgi:hypothetical protein